MYSNEVKEVVEDNIAEVADAVVAAFDSGELQAAVDEGHDAWSKWIKGLGKTFKRKVYLPTQSLDNEVHNRALTEAEVKKNVVNWPWVQDLDFLTGYFRILYQNRLVLSRVWDNKHLNRTVCGVLSLSKPHFVTYLSGGSFQCGSHCLAA